MRRRARDLRMTMAGRSKSAALLAAALVSLAASAGAEGPRKRVLPPGAAPIIERAFARAAPALRLKQASIAATHVDAVVCATEKRCHGLHLDDPQGGCAGAVAGPFCVRFLDEPPRPPERDALLRGFAEEGPDACWLDITPRDEPPEKRDPADRPRVEGERERERPPSVWLPWALLTVAPCGAGALLGWLVARIRRRPFASRRLAFAVVTFTTLAACAVSLRQLRLGMWDLALAGALLGLSFVAAAHRVKVPAKRLALAAGSTAFALLVAEIAVRALAPPPPGVDPAELHRVFFDPHEADVAFTRFELWKAGPQGTDWQGVLKEALYPKADARFFVEREGSPERVQAATRKVLHLGDSMVFGLGVQRQEAFPALLEGLEPGTLHVNAGIPGLAPDAELLMMRRWVERAPFDLVVVHLFTGNDIKEMDTAYPFCADGPLLDYGVPSLPARCRAPGARFARSRLGWMLAHSPPPYALRAFAGASTIARRSALGLLALRARLFGVPQEEEQAWAHLEAVLRAFRDELAARRIRLVVDVLPLRGALEARAPSITEAHATRTRMIETARRLGIQAIDPWRPFEEAVKREGPEPWFSTAMHHDLHFGPRGHALLARWLHEELAAHP